MKNFCHNYQSTYAASAASSNFQSIVVQRALDSANQCLKIATKYQSAISYDIMTSKMLAITFEIPPGQTLDIRSIDHDDTVSCVGDKINGGGVVDYTVGKGGQRISAEAGTYSIGCTRKSVASAAGTSIYDATGLIVNTNMGDMNIFWPPDISLPLTSAAQLEAMIKGVGQQVSSLDNNFQNMEKNINFNTFPIGAIVAWFSKSDPPPGWVKCDGSDPRCPNLSGRFLRASTSAEVGMTGGNPDSNPIIPQYGSNNRRKAGEGWSIDGDHWVSTDTSRIYITPPYTAVVYIMKVSNESIN